MSIPRRGAPPPPGSKPPPRTPVTGQTPVRPPLAGTTASTPRGVRPAIRPVKKDDTKAPTTPPRTGSVSKVTQAILHPRKALTEKIERVVEGKLGTKASDEGPKTPVEDLGRLVRTKAIVCELCRMVYLVEPGMCGASANYIYWCDGCRDQLRQQMRENYARTLPVPISPKSGTATAEPIPVKARSLDNLLPTGKEELAIPGLAIPTHPVLGNPSKFKRVIMIATQIDVYRAQRSTMTTPVAGLPHIFPEQWVIPHGPQIFSLLFTARNIYEDGGKVYMRDINTMRLIKVYMVLYDVEPTIRQINALFGFNNVHEILPNTFAWVAMPPPDYRTDRMTIQDVKRMVAAFWDNGVVVDFAYPPLGSEWPWPEYSAEAANPERKWDNTALRKLRVT